MLISIPRTPCVRPVDMSESDADDAGSVFIVPMVSSESAIFGDWLTANNPCVPGGPATPEGSAFAVVCQSAPVTNCPPLTQAMMEIGHQRAKFPLIH